VVVDDLDERSIWSVLWSVLNDDEEVKLRCTVHHMGVILTTDLFVLRRCSDATYMH